MQPRRAQQRVLLLGTELHAVPRAHCKSAGIASHGAAEATRATLVIEDQNLVADSVSLIASAVPQAAPFADGELLASSCAADAIVNPEADSRGTVASACGSIGQIHPEHGAGEDQSSAPGEHLQVGAPIRLNGGVRWR